jgi:starvation-inducible DNA-binding protein
MKINAHEASDKVTNGVGIEGVEGDVMLALSPDHPVPVQLATPTDLSADAVAVVTQAVNGLIADAFALYVKTKNFHWHLATRHFRDYHLLFDEQAEQLIESIDPLAERVRRIGGTSLRSVGQIHLLQSIPDNNREFVPLDEMVRELMADNLHIAKAQRAAMEVADEVRDHPTSNLLQELLDETEKRIWFLQASLEDAV